MRPPVFSRTVAAVEQLRAPGRRAAVAGATREVGAGCAPHSVCAPGTIIVPGSPQPSATADMQCEACAEGRYQPWGGQRSCSPWGLCMPGFGRVAGSGNTTVDVLCEACPAGRFSGADSGYIECEAQPSCEPGDGV